MYAHLLLFEKKKNTKGPLFPIFKRSFSIHKDNPALVAPILLKKSTSTVFVRFLKNTFNFTHMNYRVKKQNLTHPKAAKLATLLRCIKLEVADQLGVANSRS